MDLAFFRDLSDDYQSWESVEDYPNSLTINQIIQANAKFVSPSNLDELIVPAADLTRRDYLRYEVDSKLAQHFPILGVGTESLVFDIGTAVLKRHVSDNRSWEFLLDQMAKTIPGLFSPHYLIPVSDSDQTLLIQEKLVPIDVYKDQKNQDLILKHYPTVNQNRYINPGNLKNWEWGFPSSSNPGDWKNWEWGLDSKGVPHVFDWG